MPARTRWRRKLTVGGREFLWYVSDDADGQGPVLHLFTADKSLAVTYFLLQTRNYPGRPTLLVVQDGAVRAVPDPPAWGPRTVATPAIVRELAEWVLEHSAPFEGV